MKTIRLISVAVLLLCFSFACGDGDNPANSDAAFSNLVGTWEAIQDEFTSKANTSQKADAVADGQGGITLTIQSSGSFEVTVFLFGSPFFTLNGTARVEGNKLTLSFEELGEIEYEYTLENDRLTTIYNDATYDFDGDGTEEPATEVTVYVKA